MKKLYLLVFGALLLGGCTIHDEVKRPVTVEEYIVESVPEKMESSVTNEKSETTKSEDVSNEMFPFAVNIEDLIIEEDQGGPHPIELDHSVFFNHGINAPPKISVGRSSRYSLGICVNIEHYLEGNSGPTYIAISYPVSIENIPTKEITLFNGEGIEGNKRTVKVNTRLTLHSFNDFEYFNNAKPDFAGDEYYLFYNSLGTVSLATRNFAGNIGPEDINTMMEYVQE